MRDADLDDGELVRPRRPRWSSVRTLSPRRFATWRSSSSPAVWPPRSFHMLEAVEVEAEHGDRGAVARVRRALGERRIGHTGTLDPAATGCCCSCSAGRRGWPGS